MAGVRLAILLLGVACAAFSAPCTCGETEAPSTEAPSTVETTGSTGLFTSSLPTSTETPSECSETPYKDKIIFDGFILFRLLVDKKLPNDQWRRFVISFEEYVKYMETDSYMEAFIAYIITEQTWELKYKHICPELKKKLVYKKKGERDSTQICGEDDAPGDNWEEIGSFYCAEKKGSCESNFPIYQVRESEDDFWVLSDPEEIEAVAGYDNKTVVCYAWKDEGYKKKVHKYWEEVRTTIVKKHKMIYHLYFGESWEERYSVYTMDIEEVKILMRKGFKLRTSLSFVVDEETRTEIQETCPYLIKRTIYQQEASENSTKQLNFIDSKLYEDYGNYSEVGSFYCAPYAGYCGATTPIYYLKLGYSFSVDNMFTDDYDEILYYVNQEKYSVSSDRIICYGWDDKTVYDKNYANKVMNYGSILYRATVDIQYPVDWWRQYTISYESYKSLISTKASVEEYVSMIISEENFEIVSQTCPDLVKMSIYKKDGDRDSSCIKKESPGKGWTEIESFYCAPEPGYCGANFELMSITEREGDYFYPSAVKEIKNYEDDGITVDSLCWAWKPLNTTSTRKKYKATKKTILEKSKKIYRVVKISGSVKYHVYTFNVTVKEELISQGYQELEYVSMGCDEETKIELKETCPDLMPINVYQRSSDPPLTLVDMKVYTNFGDYELKESFYCAPYKGYCGAAKPIYFIGSNTTNVDNLYSSSYDEILDAYFDETSVFHGASWKIVCYGWDFPEDIEDPPHDGGSGSSGSGSSSSSSSEEGDF